MADSYNPPNRWRYVYLRQGSIVEEGVLSKSLIKRIKNGTLSRSAELSGDGIHWARVDQYAQLISYFEEDYQKRLKKVLEFHTN